MTRWRSELTLSWISSLMVGFLLVERGTLSHFTSGLMVRPCRRKHRTITSDCWTESVMMLMCGQSEHMKVSLWSFLFITWPRIVQKPLPDSSQLRASAYLRTWEQIKPQHIQILRCTEARSSEWSFVWGWQTKIHMCVFPLQFWLTRGERKHLLISCINCVSLLQLHLLVSQQISSQITITSCCFHDTCMWLSLSPHIVSLPHSLSLPLSLHMWNLSLMSYHDPKVVQFALSLNICLFSLPSILSSLCHIKT